MKLERSISPLLGMVVVGLASAVPVAFAFQQGTKSVVEKVERAEDRAPTSIKSAAREEWSEGKKQDEQRNAAIRRKLDECIAMSFPNETPLADVIKYVKQSTTEPATSFRVGIPIYVDRQALEDLDLTMESTVMIDLEGIPLRTSLFLVLGQKGLIYHVHMGVLIITSEDRVGSFDPSRAKPARPADVPPGGFQ